METKNKTNYYLEFIKSYKNISHNGVKPKLLLHVCCGACSIFPLLFLVDLFEITIFFSNSNIDSIDEFNKRLNALRKYVSFLNTKLNTKIVIVIDQYNYQDFKTELIPFKDEEEGKNRCKICIAKRMKNLFEYANFNSFKYVSTVMSVSRNKDAQYINFIGEKLSKEYKDIYFVQNDFKKNNGQDIGVKISKLLDIYRQEYCGCEFSK